MKEAKSVLRLTISRQWFNMIESGEKTEEYREITPYWQSRLQNSHTLFKPAGFKDFDLIELYNGPHFGQQLPRLINNCDGIRIGTGKPEWGAIPGRQYFVISVSNPRRVK